MSCIKTLFEKKILCAGSMDSYMTIKSESAGLSGFDDNQAVPVFRIIRSYFGKLEVVKPTTRFDGISIASGTTHIWYIPFEQDIYELDVNTLYVFKEGSKERIFKLNKLEDYGEQGQWLALYLEDRGFSANKAAQA